MSNAETNLFQVCDRMIFYGISMGPSMWKDLDISGLGIVTKIDV